MVTQLGLYWMGTLALALMFGSIVVALPRYRAGQDSLEAILGFGFALLMWSGFVMTSLGYQITTDAGIVIRQSDQLLSVFGLLGAGATFILLIDSVFRGVRNS